MRVLIVCVEKINRSSLLTGVVGGRWLWSKKIRPRESWPSINHSILSGNRCHHPCIKILDGLFLNTETVFKIVYLKVLTDHSN
jgi:hypothetical protein